MVIEVNAQIILAECVEGKAHTTFLIFNIYTYNIYKIYYMLIYITIYKLLTGLGH